MKSALSFITASVVALSLNFITPAHAADQPSTQPTTQPAAPVVRTKSKAGDKVFIIEPKNGATVASPLTVKFGATGVVIAKAADGIKENSGHHHLLLDLAKLPPMDQPLPSNANIIHFGQAQTETTINLTPGKHTLQLIVGDAKHVPLNPSVMSKKITITVK